MPDAPAEHRWQTSKGVRLVPAVGATVHLGAHISVSVEFEKTKAWQLDAEVMTANLLWKF